MKPVVTAAEMRALDAATIDEIGLPGIVLMETAGRAVADAAWRLAGARAGAGAVAVVCGPGNNGGDGFVCARVLRERGADATVYLLGAAAHVKGDARAHLDVLIRAGGVVHELADPDALAEHARAIARAPIVVDALFGTGLARALDGAAAALVAAIHDARAAGAKVVAADLPSGLDADTGRVLGACVDADVTVTMGLLKIALASAPGFARAGTIEIADIGIPRRLADATAVRAGLVEEDDVRRLLPRPAAMDHKGRRGHVLVVGGGPGKRGAGRLASIAAARAGAGLVTLCGPGPEISADDVVMTEVVEDPRALAALATGKAVIACGPGLGRDDRARDLVDAVLASGLPAVLDADALHAIADRPERVTGAAGPVVLTPHPGEAATLLGGAHGAQEIEADRLTAARALAARFRAIVVLKGARTIVCDGTLADDFCAINPTGGPALATGGSGDVLTGAIAALIAQGVAPADAARAAVWVHGAAGELAGARLGRGATARDVADAIAHAIVALVG